LIVKLIHRLARVFAPNKVHRQLYPPPQINFSIRSFESRDKGALLEIYDELAPRRFPDGDRLVFERLLNSESGALFVAQTPGNRVIACGGVIKIQDRVNTLCYGLVDPHFHGCGVGSALTLARLAFATRVPGLNQSLICAVPQSMGFYARFGYEQKGTWTGDDKRDYPVGVLAYPRAWLVPVFRLLRKRGILIDPALPLASSHDVEAVLSLRAGRAGGRSGR
jgi:GNAT superfamily N-acetyltransferase